MATSAVAVQLWPARVVTADATYEPCIVRAEEGQVAELLDKAGKVITIMDAPSLALVYEGTQFVRQRWQVTNGAGERWLAELIDHCGCGQTRTTAANLEELAW